MTTGLKLVEYSSHPTIFFFDSRMLPRLYFVPLQRTGFLGLSSKRKPLTLILRAATTSCHLFEGLIDGGARPWSQKLR